ncbi:kinase-like protein [Exidia glandulosa HHB12029]|uniref:non-specific serine/threonine protein kinase n=1 Tax=Exidia glandulosa HHB12029 TaxID=1314781 RepID=A0A165F2U4_EXIGL|nr:kinase-like protein [Exidia glandulosa HHB12029]
MPVSNLVPPYAAGEWIINRTVQLKSLLGVGGYACVYHAVEVCVDPPQEYAIKVVMHSSDKVKDELLKREITYHTMVSGSPDIVPVRRILREGDRTFIFMDVCRGGDLFTAIAFNKRFAGNDALLKHVFLQILDAVIFCHKRKIYHRDLKPENILFTDASCSKVQLTDFGLATTEAYTNEFRFGSLGYMAPENYSRDFLMTESKYSSKHSDIWSLGVLLFNMITNRVPWDKAHQSDAGFSEFRIYPDSYLPTIFPISDEVNQLLLRVFALDYKQRISLVDLRKEIARIDYFSTDSSDYYVDQYVLDFPSLPSYVLSLRPLLT